MTVWDDRHPSKGVRHWHPKFPETVRTAVMDRTEKPHSPLPTSITDPEAEAAHKHLSWTPDDEDTTTEGPTFSGEITGGTFVQYVGLHDGTFEVTVTVQRGQAEAIQSERGMGERNNTIRSALATAYEKADRALLVLNGYAPDEADALDA